MTRRFKYITLQLCALLLLVPLSSYAQNKPFKGKQANFIGDSITRSPTSYVDYVKEALELEIARNYGVGGGALCRRHDNSRFEGKLFRGKPVDLAYPPVVDRWEQMNTDADLIFILIGTNDASSGVPLGPVDSLDQKEFNGGLNILLSGLKEQSPDSVIVISTILKRRSGGATLIPYNNAIKDAAERHGVICYDAHSLVGLDLGQELRDKSLKNTADGLHPNAAGAKIIGNKIAEFINDNYQNMP